MKTLALPEKVIKFINALNESGFEAFAVGGCVRDMILGKTPEDYDITTNALPEETKKVFSSLKTVDTGIKHGTVMVIDEGFSVEITTYRVDGEYKDNRHPVNVTFSKKLKDDLSRRDFTMNALAFNRMTGVVDCFGGLDDIKNKIIRTVGKSVDRFNEDALRILRAVRFSSVLGFELDEETKAAVHKYAHLLCNISKERIFSEFKKLLCAANVGTVLAEYRDVAEIIIPALSKLSKEEYKISAEMTKAADCDFVSRFSAFLFFIPTDEACSALKNLKCDKATIANVRSILSCRDISYIDSEESALLCLKVCDKEIIKFLNLKLLYNTVCNNIDFKKETLRQIEYIEKALGSKRAYKISQLDISGNDLIENSIAKGPDIGDMLDKILLDVISGRVENNRTDILNHLKN